MKEAEMFINFMTRPEISLKNTEYIGYSTTNSETMRMLGDKIINNNAAYPSGDELEGSEIFLDPGEFIKKYDKLLTEIKAN